MSFFEQILTENGDINREQPPMPGGPIQGQTALLGGGGGLSAAAASGTSRRDLKQGQFDIRALQHKQQMAEITRHPFYKKRGANIY
jgi:hypothetical protein